MGRPIDRIRPAPVTTATLSSRPEREYIGPYLAPEVRGRQAEAADEIAGVRLGPAPAGRARSGCQRSAEEPAEVAAGEPSRHGLAVRRGATGVLIAERSE